jgi:hydroxymethylpyrimidine pyrophosphatase-like HAD family hydrolase
MRYLALCCDYDGTLATEGEVFPETIAALERLVASGRRPILVTGRELDELKTVCSCLHLFEFVVAENGAVLYQPSTNSITLLAERPPAAFVAALRARGVGPIAVGRVIVATWEPHETVVLETIKAQGLELQVIFNKGAVMILPAGVNKATGLAAALKKMGLSAHNAVGIGDAENDHALLGMCECGVAVANALPTLKEAADFVTTAARGAGVAELIDAILGDDLASHEPELTRHHLLLGWDCADREVRLRPYGENILLAGPAGSGKSATTAALLEGLSAARYTFCVIDSKGDHDATGDAVSLGTAGRPPSVEEILKLFRNPGESGVINLTGLPAEERQSFFAALLPRFSALRQASGRPHWLVIESGFPADGASVLQITSSPKLLAREALAGVSLLIATGKSPARMLQEFCQVTATHAPTMDPVDLQPGEALAWRPQSRNAAPFRMRIKPRQQ